MTRIIDTKPKRYSLATLPAGFAIAAMVIIGILAVPANAQSDHSRREYHHNWSGGYYRAPPVVYGSTFGSSYHGYYGTPYNYPPPVIYYPPVGFSTIIR